MELTCKHAEGELVCDESMMKYAGLCCIMMIGVIWGNATPKLEPRIHDLNFTYNCANRNQYVRLRHKLYVV